MNLRSIHKTFLHELFAKNKVCGFRAVKTSSKGIHEVSVKYFLQTGTTAMLNNNDTCLGKILLRMNIVSNKLKTL